MASAAFVTAGTALWNVTSPQAIKFSSLFIGGALTQFVSILPEKVGEAGMQAFWRNPNPLIVIPSSVILAAGRIGKVAGLLAQNIAFSLGVAFIAGSLSANPAAAGIAFTVSMIATSGSLIVLNLLPPDPFGIYKTFSLFHVFKLAPIDLINQIGLIFLGVKIGSFGGVPGAITGGVVAFGILCSIHSIGLVVSLSSRFVSRAANSLLSNSNNATTNGYSKEE